MPRPKKLTPLIVPTIQGFVSTPDLAVLNEDEKKLLSATTGLQFSETDWHQLEQARAELTLARWARPQAIEVRAVAKRLKSIEKEATGLLVALTGSNPTSQEGMRSYSIDKISVLLSAQWFKGPPSFIEMITMLAGLRSVAHKAVAEAEYPQGDLWSNDWPNFVSSLASLYEHKGRTATATKRWQDQHRQSPFVTFVEAVVKTLPKMAQLHIHSPGAMAKAVADALAKHRKKHPNRAGQFTTDSAIKSPSTKD